MQIRDAGIQDLDRLQALYTDTFPDEDLVPLVTALQHQGEGVLSLMAAEDLQTIGHVMFTMSDIAEGAGRIALLGPLAVHPDHQRQGVGTALVRHGHARLAELGIAQVLVLGDPDYYSRHGFRTEAALRPPYPLPEEWLPAWQSLALGGAEPLAGTLAVPAPWQDPALWS